MATSTIYPSDNLQKFQITLGGTSGRSYEYNCPSGLYLVYGLSPTASASALFLVNISTSNVNQCIVYTVFQEPAGNSKLSVTADLGKITITQSTAWYRVMIIGSTKNDVAL